MELFQKLREVAVEQSLSGEFPSWLLADVIAIADRPELFREKAELIQKLISQVEDYDPYAGTGCFGSGASAGMIETTLGQIRS